MPESKDPQQITGSRTLWSGCGEYVAKLYQLNKATYQEDGNLISDVSGNSVPPEKGLELIYQLLTWLDTKASALMRLNGVMTAAGTFMLGALDNAPFGEIPTRNALLVTVVMIALSITSILLCLYVVRVGWRFLNKVSKPSPDLYTYRKEIVSLQRVAHRRQWVYMGAWWLSLLSGIASFIAIAIFSYYKLRGFFL